MNKNLFALAALAAVLVVGCGKEAPVEADNPAESPVAGNEVSLPEEAIKTAGIRTEPVSRRDLDIVLESPGTVTLPADRHAVVSPPVAGRVLRLYAKVGDNVRQGQPLAEIGSGDLALASSAVAEAETEVSQASAGVRQQAAAVDLAKGHLRTAESNLARQRKFAQAGAFSQPGLTQARNELSEAQTEEAAARSALAGAESRLDRSERLSREGLVSKADLDQAKLDFQQAQIRVSRAQQRLALAQQTLQRESRIVDQGLLNAREIQNAEAEVRAAKLELDQARVNLEGARAALTGARKAVQNARVNAAALRGGASGGGSTVTLTAPIAGTVVEREATLGQAVERSSTLFDIDDDDTMWITANVPEGDISRVRSGASVTVTAAAFPGRTFSGTVQILGERLDPKTRTLPVQCRIPNSQGLLRAGLTARARIAVGSRVTALAVASAAIVGEGEDLAVFVEEGGKFVKRAVKTGRKSGDFVEIVEGLKPGERVVVAGAFTLYSESKASEEGGGD